MGVSSRSYGSTDAIKPEPVLYHQLLSSGAVWGPGIVTSIIELLLCSIYRKDKEF